MSAPPRRVSLRAIAIGAIGCLAIAVGEPFGVLVMQSSPMAADYSTGAALCLFFLFTLLINPLAQWLTGSSLHSGELATVYIMSWGPPFPLGA